jgi:hypothetical protein
LSSAVIVEAARVESQYVYGTLTTMIRWVFVIFVGLVVFANLLPWLQKLGIGRLPGDLRFRLFGRIYTIPFASTILLSLGILLLAKFL